MICHLLFSSAFDSEPNILSINNRYYSIRTGCLLLFALISEAKNPVMLFQPPVGGAEPHLSVRNSPKVSLTLNAYWTVSGNFGLPIIKLYWFNPIHLPEQS